MDPKRFDQLPSVTSVLQTDAVRNLSAQHGVSRVTQWVRSALAQLRRNLATESNMLERTRLIERAVAIVGEQASRSAIERLGPVINATGVLLHTNLGRAALADRAIQAITEAARFANVELDLETGERRRRGYQLDALWQSLTGAEAALVVNNCASATLLTLRALAVDREVVVSRGQLIEIGGAFRLPDVFAQSGANLKEVGTTNRTRLSDYESALGPQSAALLRVHESNFRIVGFTESVPIAELAALAHQRGVLAIDDVGSGCLYDLRTLGLPAEPVVGESIRAGADIVLFSGDKLLGGPQCGVILGRKSLIDVIERHPLARAVRIDKLTLAALQATLEIHSLGRAFDEVPILAQLSTPMSELESRGRTLIDLVRRQSDSLHLDLRPSQSAIGGGAVPTGELPTWVVAVAAPTCAASELARRLRAGQPAVVGRTENQAVLLDLRTILPDQIEPLAQAVGNV